RVPADRAQGNGRAAAAMGGRGGRPARERPRFRRHDAAGGGCNGIARISREAGAAAVGPPRITAAAEGSGRALLRLARRGAKGGGRRPAGTNGNDVIVNRARGCRAPGFKRRSKAGTVSNNKESTDGARRPRPQRPPGPDIP